MTIPDSPDFRSPAFLRQHISWVMDFYSGRAIDPSGGMYHYFLDDGTVFDARTRHLVNATLLHHYARHALQAHRRNALSGRRAPRG